MTGARWVPKFSWGVRAHAYVVIFHGNFDRGQKFSSILWYVLRMHKVVINTKNCTYSPDVAILDGVSVALGEAETSDRNAVVMRNAIPLPKRKPQKVVLSEITPQNQLRNYLSKSIVRAHSRPEW